MFGQVSDGNLFGDIEYVRKSLVLGDYEAAESCALYALSFSDLEYILRESDDLKSTFFASAETRVRNFLEVRDQMICAQCLTGEHGGHGGHAELIWADGEVKSRDSILEVKKTAHLYQTMRRRGVVDHESADDLRRRVVVHPDHLWKTVWGIIVGFCTVLWMYQYLQLLKCRKVLWNGRWMRCSYWIC